MKSGLAILALLAGTVAAHASGTMVFDPDASGATFFVTPSQNIGCVYTPVGGSTVYVPEDGGPELSCDRVVPKYLRFVLGASGPANLIDNVGDAGCCTSENPLPYGTKWRIEPFTCESETTGLSCQRDDGHGFFVSKAKVSVY